MKRESSIRSIASGLLSKPCLVLFCVLFPLYTPTLAQIVPPPQTVPLPGDQNLIQERQQKLLEDQQRRLEELKRLPNELTAQGKYVTASLTYAHSLERPSGWKRERPVYFSLGLTY